VKNCLDGAFLEYLDSSSWYLIDLFYAKSIFALETILFLVVCDNDLSEKVGIHEKYIKYDMV